MYLQVIFPVLKNLSIDRVGELKKIWDGQLSPASFSKLERLTVNHCDKLLHLVPTQMQNRLQTLKYIEVEECSSLEGIFEVSGLEGSEHHVKEINFLSLTDLDLRGLPCFTGISKSRLNRQLEVSSLCRDSLTDEQSLFSDPKVSVPFLK